MTGFVFSERIDSLLHANAPMTKSPVTETSGERLVERIGRKLTGAVGCSTKKSAPDVRPDAHQLESPTSNAGANLETAASRPARARGSGPTAHGKTWMDPLGFQDCERLGTGIATKSWSSYGNDMFPSRHPILTLSSPPLLVGVLLAGCESSTPTVPEVRTTEQAVGTATVTSCNRDEEIMVAHQVIALRAMINDPGFESCLEDLADNPVFYQPCPEDEWNSDAGASPAEVASFITELARNNAPLELVCEQCEGESHTDGTTRVACAGFGEPSPLQPIEMSLAEEFFEILGRKEGPGDYSSLSELGQGARTILHEMMHQFGFYHYQENGPYCLEKDPKTGIPDLVARCISQSVANRDAQMLCNDASKVRLNSECVSIERHFLVDNPSNIQNLGAGHIVSGDFNGDGFDDIAATALRDVGGNALAPTIIVRHGTAYGLIGGSVVASPGLGGEITALAAGDLNDDGFDDLIAGNGNASQGDGTVFVHWGTEEGVGYRDQGHGPNTGQPTFPWSHRFVGNESGGRFGAALAVGSTSIPTYNPVLVVGSPGAAGGGKITAMLTNGFLNQEPLKFVSEFSLQGATPTAEFGASLATLDGGGSDNVLIGAPGEASNSGRAYRVSLLDIDRGAGPSEVIKATFGTDSSPGNRFGEALAYGTLGLHDDGESLKTVTVAVGAPGDSRVDFFTDAGEFRLRMFGVQGYGEHLSPINPGKVSGDNQSYLLVGLPGAGSGVAEVITTNDSSGTSVWSVHEVLGQVGLSDEEAGDQFGTAFAWGDFNGDGVQDLAVAGPGEYQDSLEKISGAVHTFTWAWDNADDSCDLLVPWKTYAPDGGLGENIAPVVNFGRLIGGEIEKGQVVFWNCSLFEATESFLATSADTPSASPEKWVELQTLTRFRTEPDFTEFGPDEWRFSFDGEGTFIHDEMNFRVGFNSLGFEEVGYTNISSPIFTTNEFHQIGDQITFEIYLPAEAAPTGYDGAIDLHVSVLSAGLFNQPLGHIELAGLALDEWHALSFDFPELYQSLFLGNDVQAQFHIAINSHTDEPQGLRLDNLHFTGDLTPHPNPARAVTSTVMDSNPFVCGGECLNAVPVAPGQQLGGGGFGTTGAIWFVASDDLAGWTTSSLDGRTIEVNGENVASGQTPLPPSVDGFYYFHFGPGQFPWASWTYW